MRLSFFVSCMAHRIKSRAGQASFVNTYPSNLNSILDNKYLAKDIWYKLFDGAKVDQATSLALLPLDENQVLTVSKDKRKTVKHALLSNKNADFTLAVSTEILKSKWFSVEYATTWLKNNLVPRELIKEVARIENKSYALNQLSDRDLYPINEAVSRLEDIMITSQITLGRLLDCRPELVSELVCSDRDDIILGLSYNQWLKDPLHVDSLFESIKKKFASEKYINHKLRDALINLLINPNISIAKSREIYDLVNQNISIYKDWRHVNLINIYRERLQKFPDIEILADGNWDKVERKDVADFIINIICSIDFNRYPSLRSYVLSNRYASSSTPQQLIKNEDIVNYTFENTILGTKEFKPHMLTDEMLLQLESNLDNLGEVAWDLFWFLLPNFEGTLKELSTQVERLNK